jgi:hypothetical protein
MGATQHNQCDLTGRGVNRLGQRRQHQKNDGAAPNTGAANAAASGAFGDFVAAGINAMGALSA